MLLAITALGPGRNLSSGGGDDGGGGINFVINPGTRVEDGYPVTKDELFSFGTLGLGATLFFSAASGLIGYYVNVSLGLAFSSGLPAGISEFYNASRGWALGGAIVSLVIGVVISLLGIAKARRIVKRTTFRGKDVQGQASQS